MRVIRSKHVEIESKYDRNVYTEINRSNYSLHRIIHYILKDWCCFPKQVIKTMYYYSDLVCNNSC